jgi:hypothetical protein
MVPDNAHTHTHAIKPPRTHMGIYVIWSLETVKVEAILDNVSTRTTYNLNQTIRDFLKTIFLTGVHGQPASFHPVRSTDKE